MHEHGLARLRCVMRPLARHGCVPYAVAAQWLCTAQGRFSTQRVDHEWRELAWTKCAHPCSHTPTQKHCQDALDRVGSSQVTEKVSLPAHTIPTPSHYQLTPSPSPSPPRFEGSLPAHPIPMQPPHTPTCLIWFWFFAHPGSYHLASHASWSATSPFHVHATGVFSVAHDLRMVLISLAISCMLWLASVSGLLFATPIYVVPRSSIYSPSSWHHCSHTCAYIIFC
jgi:hypothetical protein